MISDYILQNIKDFTEQDFLSWQSNMKDIERNLPQVLDVTSHSNLISHNNESSYHVDSHVNNTIPHNNAEAFHTNNHTNQNIPHTDWGGYHDNNHSNGHSNYSVPPDHSNNHTNRSPHSQVAQSHSNNHTNGNPHTNNPARHWDTHVNTTTPHNNTGGGHSNNHTNRAGHTNTGHNNYVPGNHTNNGRPRNDPAHRDFCTPRCHYNDHTNNSHQNSGHSNVAPHTNTGGGHSDNGLYNQTINHTDRAPHSNSGHTQTHPHSNHTQHSNSGHSQAFPHLNHNQHLNNHGHSNTIPHNNTNASHNNNGKHSQFTPHTDVKSSHSNTGHTNNVPHVNVDSHNNVGFNHQNYIPSKPRIFNIEENKELTGMVKIGLFSYDKNSDGHGSQDKDSQDVLYTLRIRRVKNLNGSANVSNWTTLLNQSAIDTFELNTLNPLNNGNLDYTQAEGYYEIKAVATNKSKAENGVTKTYVSDAQTVEVKIVHNNRPSVEVLNGGEFVGFTFGESGALNPSDEFKSYESKLYSRADESQIQGLFVNLKIKDKDKTQWQQGVVYLEQSGQKIVGTEAQIVWENGQTKIQSGGQEKEGYVFLDKDKLLQVGTRTDVNVVVKIEDYFDPGLKFKTAETVHIHKISESNPELMLVNIDAVAPYVELSKNGSEKYEKTHSIDINASDDLSGVDKVYYQWTKGTESYKDSEWIEIDHSTKVSTPLNQSGDYYLNVKAIDRLGNTGVSQSGRFRIDNTAPILDISYNDELTNENLAIYVNASDSFSGIDKIIMPDGSIVKANSATFITPQNGMFTFTVVDNVGHVISQTITITNIDKTPPDASLIEYELSTDNWTNTNVIISIDASKADDSGISHIKLPNGKIVNGDKATYEVGENGSYTFIITDKAGNDVNKTINVTNIDKVPPATPVIIVPQSGWTNKNVVVTIDNIKDNLSGVEKVEYRLSNDSSITPWYIYHNGFTITTEGITTINAKVTDKAGNVSEIAFETVKIDKSAPFNNQIKIRQKP